MADANVLEEFIVKIGLDPSDYKKESAEFQSRLGKDRETSVRAGRQLEDSAKRQREGFRSVKGEVAGLLATLVGAAGLRAVVENTVRTDAAIGRMSRTLGLNARELAAWQGALKGAGGSASDAANDLQILVGASQDLKLGIVPDIAKWLQVLKIAPEELENPTEALLKISDRLSKMDPVQGASLAQRMGFSPAMVTTLMRGRTAVSDLLREQRQLNNVTDQGTVKAEEFDRQIKTLKTSAESLGRSLTTALLPGLQGVLDVLLQIAAGQDAPDAIRNALPQSIRGAGAPQRDNRSPFVRRLQSMLGIEPVPAPASAAMTGGAPVRGIATAPVSASAKGRFDQVVGFFRSKGWPLAAAEGIAAGAWAESRLDPKAFNPADGGQGAFGIGQWRGMRQRRLKAMYGDAPTMAQQLEYMQWELNNDPTERKAGKAIYDAQTPEAALAAYITKFMRPAQGYETTSDLDRGGRALAQWGTVNVNVGGVTVTTQATDARGMATGAAAALKPAVATAVQGLQ